VSERRVLWLVRDAREAAEDAPVSEQDVLLVVDDASDDELVDAVFATDVAIVW
jgi:hypothetical protein